MTIDEVLDIKEKPPIIDLTGSPTIIDLIADLKMLAREIGGGHYTNKEAEEKIINLAQLLFDSTESLVISLDDLTKGIKQASGISDDYIYLKKKAQHTYYHKGEEK